MPRGPKKVSRRGRIRRLTQAAYNRATRNEYDVLHSQYTGYHSRLVEMVVPKVIFDRKSQFLTHLATGLKAWYSIASSGSEIEIQIALYNESCVIISSNKNETAQFMYDEFVKEKALDFLKNLHGVALMAAEKAAKSRAVESFRIERQTRKLASELMRDRETGLPLLEELKREGKNICVQFDASGDIGEAFADFLNRSNGMENKYIAMITASGAEAHAEQKILFAMCKAAKHVPDKTVSVVFCGTFRPCRGCYESLSVVRKYLFGNIQFGVRPGHFWGTTAKSHIEIIRRLMDDNVISQSQFQTDFDEDGRLRGLTDVTHRPSLRTRDEDEVEGLHFATDSESDYSDGDGGDDS